MLLIRLYDPPFPDQEIAGTIGKVGLCDLCGLEVPGGIHTEPCWTPDDQPEPADPRWAVEAAAEAAGWHVSTTKIYNHSGELIGPSLRPGGTDLRAATMGSTLHTLVCPNCCPSAGLKPNRRAEAAA